VVEALEVVLGSVEVALEAEASALIGVAANRAFGPPLHGVQGSGGADASYC
jgi:hypothetical protein